MTRFAWRQFRLQALVALAVVAVIGALALATHPQLVQLSDRHAEVALKTAHSWLQTLNGRALLVVPALIGMFWGAPLLARELESGTLRVAWTQSVTRTRWLVVKLGLVGALSLLLVGLLSLTVTWWFGLIDRVNLNRFSPEVFSERALTPVAYAAFALALGVALGCVLRRTVPAMAATLAIFVALRLAVTYWLRPHFQAPVHVSIRLTTEGLRSLYTPKFGGPTIATLNYDRAGDWLISSGGTIVDASGKVVNGLATRLGQGSPEALRAGLARLHLYAPVVYQPASRYWTFQWIETGIFAGLALVLTIFSFWWVRRRL